MRIGVIVICILLLSQTASAGQDSVEQAIDFLKTACAAGEKVEIKVEGDGGLSLIKKGVQGRIYFSKNDARGVAEGLSSELQSKNLDSVRQCMRPYISRILDAILGPSSNSSLSQGALLTRNASNPVFENNILRIEVLGLQDLGPYFNLVLKHTNKTQQPIEIRCFEHRTDTFLIDNRDVEYHYITPYAAGRGDDLTVSDRGRAVELAPGTPRVISFQFDHSAGSYGNVFNFSTKYGWCFKQRFSLPRNLIYVNIKNIRFG